MLVQKFLRDNSLETLVEKYGIKVVEHPTDGRVILNYSQIDSVKTEPIVMECRGLVLDKNNNWNVVARSFDRFFNLFEHSELTDTFDWSDFSCTSKEDGSLILFYFYNGEWQINTRGSFADSICGFSDKTWKELIINLLPNDTSMFLKNFTYIFEFCSLQNKIVRNYSEPTLYLIGIRDNKNNNDIKNSSLDIEAKHLGLKRPVSYDFKSLQEIQNFLKQQESEDASFEGVVLRDKNGLRMKIKSSTYIALHRLRGENNNIFNPKYLIHFVLSGESNELLTYFNEAKDAYYKCEALVHNELSNLTDIFLATKNIEDQKEFASAVIKKYNTKFPNILFKLKKEFGTQATKENLLAIWRDSADMIYKVIYKK